MTAVRDLESERSESNGVGFPMHPKSAPWCQSADGQVAIVVDDLFAAIAFSTDLAVDLRGKGTGGELRPTDDRCDRQPEARRPVNSFDHRNRETTSRPIRHPVLKDLTSAGRSARCGETPVSRFYPRRTARGLRARVWQFESAGDVATATGLFVAALATIGAAVFGIAVGREAGKSEGSG
jgi:hypothetical protein